MQKPVLEVLLDFLVMVVWTAGMTVLSPLIAAWAVKDMTRDLVELLQRKFSR